MPVDASAVARTVGIETTYVNQSVGGVQFLPMRIAVFAQGNTAAVFAATKFQALSSYAVGLAMGFGSPAHNIMRQLMPANGDGVGSIPVTIYPLTDAGGAVAAAGAIAVTGTQSTSGTGYVRIGNVLSQAFTLIAGDSLPTITGKIVAAINAILHMPFTAAAATAPDRVVLTAKWKGTTANGILIEALVDSALGITYAMTQPTGGLTDPTLDTPLTQMGNVWETLVINQFTTANATALDTLKTVGEGRWLQTVRRPFVAFCGNGVASMSTATSVTTTRNTDRVNCQLVNPGGADMPFVIAARQVARIASMANNNPPTGYGGLKAETLSPGLDSVQWDYPTRDAAVKAGSSTVEVIDNVVQLSDVVTMYRPTGENPPAYRYVVDQIKLWNVTYNVDRIFTAQEWASAPLIPDGQPTNNPNARQPKSAVTQMRALIDDLALAAIIADPEFAKKNTIAWIDTSNPKRLNVQTTLKIAGNTEIKSVVVQWAFNYGTAPLAA
jgi:phage tail sheath gpL-like